MPQTRRVLISGAGICGPVLGFLLQKLGDSVTIIERAPFMRTTGQQVDISGEALEIIRLMGIRSAIRERIIADDGLRFVDSDGNIKAELALKDTGDGIVKEYEVLRGSVADVIYDVTKDKMEYLFSETIAALKQSEKGVTVSFSNSADRDFDLVVGADGMRSKTRDLAFPHSGVEVRPIASSYCAFYSAPWQYQDETWTRWNPLPGRRCVTLRPDAKRGNTGMYLIAVDAQLDGVASLSMEQQKARWRDYFDDGDFLEKKRVLQAMEDDNGFYSTDLAQVHMPTWVNGRVAVVGDAGYATSPLTGQGTSLAMIGAYVLAGCLSQNEDVVVALRQYDQSIRPFVKDKQAIPPGAPRIANPATEWGIQIMYTLAWLASLAFKIGLVDLIKRVVSGLPLQSKELGLPHYPALVQALASVTEKE